MRIPPQQISQSVTTPLSEKPKRQNVTETSFLGKTKKSEAAPKEDFESSALISKQELMQLATDFKNGTINKKQARSRFISAVINSSLQDKLGNEDREKITAGIEKFFSDDQEFLHKLAENLNKLA